MEEKIARWYKQGLWTDKMVHDAVDNSVITAEQYTEITGKEY